MTIWPIIIATLWVSYKGFNSQSFFQRYMFQVDAILVKREYIRLISSGFLHASWGHLFFNMLALYLFGELMANFLGPINFLLLYFASLIGADLLSLFIHKNHGSYSAIGASGAVSGVLLGYVALFPYNDIGFIFLPFISFPAWIWGLAYVLISIYGIGSQRGNIGHDAHLGGGIIGMLIIIAFYPTLTLGYHWLPILAILIPAITFIVLIVRKPQWLMLKQAQYQQVHTDTIEDRYNTAKKNQEQELNKLLEKVGRLGYDKLSAAEKQRLDELSGN